MPFVERLDVEAGFSPTEALRAATSLPAQRFGLTDRGTAKAGARADLLLVTGDPTSNISGTLSIRSVWRRGNEVLYPPDSTVDLPVHTLDHRILKYTVYVGKISHNLTT